MASCTTCNSLYRSVDRFCTTCGSPLKPALKDVTRIAVGSVFLIGFVLISIGVGKLDAMITELRSTGDVNQTTNVNGNRKGLDRNQSSWATLNGTTWTGTFDGRPAELKVTSPTTAEMTYGGVREAFAVGTEPDGQIALRGTGFRRMTPSASISLDTLHGRLASDFRSMSGTWKDASGRAGRWTLSRSLNEKERGSTGVLSNGVPPKTPALSMPDTTAPRISAVKVVDITSNSARIMWTTDEPADSQVEYCVGPPFRCYETVLVSMRSNFHNVELHDLMSNEYYSVRLKSRDAASNLGVWRNDIAFGTRRSLGSQSASESRTTIP